MGLGALLLSVVVEISPGDADVELTAALIAACTSAVPSGSCVPADGKRDGPGASAVAIVSWRGDDRVELVVGVRGQKDVKWRSQQLQFRPADRPRERWRAVGLAIGTLVGESHEALDEPATVATPAQRKITRPGMDSAHTAKPFAGPEPAALAVWLDLGPMVAPALDDGTWRAGAFLRSAYQPRHFFAFGSLSASYALRPTDARGVTLGWATFAAGAGHALGALTGRFSLELRVDLLWQRVGLSALDPETGRTGTTNTSLWGVRAGIDGSFMLAPALGLMLGAEISRLSSAIDVRVRDEPVGALGSTQYALVGGARIRLR